MQFYYKQKDNTKYIIRIAQLILITYFIVITFLNKSVKELLHFKNIKRLVENTCVLFSVLINDGSAVELNHMRYVPFITLNSLNSLNLEKVLLGKTLLVKVSSFQK